MAMRLELQSAAARLATAAAQDRRHQRARVCDSQYHARLSASCQWLQQQARQLKTAIRTSEQSELPSGCPEVGLAADSCQACCCS